MMFRAESRGVAVMLKILAMVEDGCEVGDLAVVAEVGG